jgi:hypothetical protein
MFVEWFDKDKVLLASIHLNRAEMDGITAKPREEAIIKASFPLWMRFSDATESKYSSFRTLPAL